MSLQSYYDRYCGDLSVCLRNLVVTDATGILLDPMVALDGVITRFRQANERGGKIIFVGNGGSAGNASHHAYDYWKNGKLRAICFNDPSLLTGSANDFGYDQVFAKPIAMFAKPGDVLVAISSSGKSPNIVNAAWEARKLGCEVVTMSAFGADNPLRRAGDVNIYLETSLYGHAEIGHLTIMHALLDYTLYGDTPSLPDVRALGPAAARNGMRFSREKIKTPYELAAIARDLKAQGKTVVHCHGVFDLVHPGHANYFEQAKRIGDVVYVGVIADRFVRKGPGRPYFNEQERLAWVASLEGVDYVVLNEEEGPWSLMRTVRPNVYVKDEGDRKKLDDPSSKIHEDIRVIEEVGGRFMFVPVEVNIHSTDIFRKFDLD